MRKGTATVSDGFDGCIAVCLSFYRQQSTMKCRGKAINRSWSVTTRSTPPFIQRRPQIDTIVFYYSLTYHNTQAGPAPLWAWPTLRSTEAFHFWTQKTTKESHSISYSWDTGWGPAVGKANGYQDVSNSMTPLPGWKHRMTLYYVLVCLLYPSFLSSGISSTKSHKVNCQSYIHMNIFQGGNHTKQNTQLFTHDHSACLLILTQFPSIKYLRWS